MYTIRRRAVDDFVLADACDLTATAVHTTFKIVQEEMQVLRLMASVGVATVSTGNITVVFYRRPTIASASGQVTLGTLLIPGGTAVGKTVYKDIAPVTVFPGEQIAYEVTVAAAGGSAAGKAYLNVGLADNPDAAANQSNMLASA